MTEGGVKTASTANDDMANNARRMNRRASESFDFSGGGAEFGMLRIGGVGGQMGGQMGDDDAGGRRTRAGLQLVCTCAIERLYYCFTHVSLDFGHRHPFAMAIPCSSTHRSSLNVGRQRRHNMGEELSKLRTDDRLTIDTVALYTTLVLCNTCTHSPSYTQL